jgi:hypothetical protein
MPLEHTDDAAKTKRKLEVQDLCEWKRASMRKDTDEGTMDQPTDPFYIFSDLFNISSKASSVTYFFLEKTKCAVTQPHQLSL